MIIERAEYRVIQVEHYGVEAGAEVQTQLTLTCVEHGPSFLRDPLLVFDEPRYDVKVGEVFLFSVERKPL